MRSCCGPCYLQRPTATNHGAPLRRAGGKPLTVRAGHRGASGVRLAAPRCPCGTSPPHRECAPGARHG